MKKGFSSQIGNKLRSRSGESISETLVALVISSLALVMLAGAISAASNMVTKTRVKLEKYYAANEYVAKQTGEIASNDPDKALTSKTITIKDGNSIVIFEKSNVPVYINKVFNDQVAAYKIPK